MRDTEQPDATACIKTIKSVELNRELKKIVKLNIKNIKLKLFRHVKVNFLPKVRNISGIKFHTPIP